MLAFGWRAVFYSFGVLGIVWAMAFNVFYRNHPEDHPGVNRAELAQIRGLSGDGGPKAPARVQPGRSDAFRTRVIGALAGSVDCMLCAPSLVIRSVGPVLRRRYHTDLSMTS